MNKTSLIMGGCPYNDEHDYFQKKLKMKDFCCEFNVIDNFWTARVTSHIPIKEVPENITKENILKPIKLLNKTLKMSGIEKPELLYKHLILTLSLVQRKKMKLFPAIEEAKKMGIDVMDLCHVIHHSSRLIKIKIMIAL